MKDIIEKILKDLLGHYLALDDEGLKTDLKFANTATKERVKTIDDLQVIIYSNDHNPPYFHVRTKNGNIMPN